MVRLLASVFICILALILAADGLPVSAQTSRVIRIGASAARARTVQAAKAVCALMDRARKRYDFNCETTPLQSPDELLAQLREGQLQVAVIGSDWQPRAGASDLRALFALDEQPLTILAPKNRDFKTVEDFDGKKIYIWNRKHHVRAFEKLHTVLKFAVDASAAKMSLPDLVQLLCNQPPQADAVLTFTAHPNALVKTAIETGCAKLLPLPPTAIETLTNKHRFFRLATIPAAIYKDSAAIASVAVGVTFVSHQTAAVLPVYVAVSTVFDNFRRFQALYTPAANLNIDNPVEQAAIMDNFRSAPWHPGAEQYFLEKGWESLWYYVIVAYFDTADKAHRLAKLLQKEMGENRKLHVRQALNGDYAVSAGDRLKKAETRGVLAELRRLKYGIKGQVASTVDFVEPQEAER